MSREGQSETSKIAANELHRSWLRKINVRSLKVPAARTLHDFSLLIVISKTLEHCKWPAKTLSRRQ